MAGRRTTQFLLIAVSAGLLLAAVPALVAEAGALAGALRPPAMRALAIASGEQQPAASYTSRDEFLRSCLDIPASLPGLLLPASDRRSLLENCRTAARAIAAELPTYALPHLVDADTSAALGEPFLSELDATRRLAPHVHWQADRRVILAREQVADLDDAARKNLDQDLLELFGSREGRRVLAMHFLRWPDMRDRLTTLAETVPEADQRDFLARVKQQAMDAP